MIGMPPPSSAGPLAGSTNQDFAGMPDSRTGGGVNAGGAKNRMQQKRHTRPIN